MGSLGFRNQADNKKPDLADRLFCALVLVSRPELEPGAYGLTVRRSVAAYGRPGLDFQGLGGAARYDAVDFA
jgi:hypothetical protein